MYAAIAAEIDPANIATRIDFSFTENTLGSCSRAAAPITGVASRKLNLAAAALSNPKNRLPAIEVPDLDIPGNRAKAWLIPIKTDLGKLNFDIS